MRKYCSKVIIEKIFEPCILYLLLEKPSYGYELKQNLDERCECKVNIGNLYRSLVRLRKEGFISRKKSVSKIGPDPTIYSITDKGMKLLGEWIYELNKEMLIVKKLITNYKKIHDTSNSK